MEKFLSCLSKFFQNNEEDKLSWLEILTIKQMGLMYCKKQSKYKETRGISCPTS